MNMLEVPRHSRTVGDEITARHGGGENGGDTAAEWDVYIASASNFSIAQERMEEAVAAGVDFRDLLALQAERHV